MNIEILSTILTGAATGVTVLFGVWRMQSAYEARTEQAHADVARDVANLRERMALLEGEVRGFMAGFRAQQI